MPTIDELLREPVPWDIACLDRLSLNGYLPLLQSSGQLVTFLTQHCGQPIPSPVLLQQMSATCVRAVRAFAAAQPVPLVPFEHGVRKDDVAAAHRARCAGTDGVVFIGVAQANAQAFKASKQTAGTAVNFQSSRQAVYVNYYYCYVLDEDFGPAFIKSCSYAPCTLTSCLHGHEWAKRQLTHERIAFEALDNGFRACADPARLQAMCDTLGTDPIQAFFTKGLARLPLPLTAADRQAGYDYRLSIWQREVSRTQGFADPSHGQAFFEAVLREHLDRGRPARIPLLFERRVQKTTPGLARTRVFQEGVAPSVHVEYKHCPVKPYFKERRALRTEMTINDPTDLGVKKDIRNLPYLTRLGREVTRRLVAVQRGSQACTVSGEGLARVVQPTVTGDGQRASGLRLGDRRAMAVLAALLLLLHLPSGLTHRAVRQRVAPYRGCDLRADTSGQMTYDLRRLRLKGLVWRIPHSHRYQVTPSGYRVAVLVTTLDARVLRTAFAAFDAGDPVPRPLAEALAEVARQLDALVDEAKLEPAA